MSNLFAFSQARESTMSTQPSGHYDAEQQLWIADEVSHATERMPVEGGTVQSTVHVTGTPNGFDHGYDYAID